MNRLVVVVSILLAPVWASSPLYELRGSQEFQNDIDGHTCKQLSINGRKIAWVNGTTQTAIGLVVRICEQEKPPYDEAVNPGTVYGGVLDGWYVIDMATGEKSQIRLPQLDYFSNPSFCDKWAAYWGTAGDSKYSLVLADLNKKSVVNSSGVGILQLETDYMYHLAPAIWNADCTAATFKDDRYIKTTTISVRNK